MTFDPPTIPPERLIYETTLSGAGMWSKVIRRGRVLRLTDLEGGTNVGMLLYNADEKSERYNMPDTLKGQHIFYLRAPYCLHSDMGRLFASIIADSSGWHDTVCGCSDAALVKSKYGEGDYQHARNDFIRNGRECFLIELAKWGLGKRDLVPNLNWFSKVVSDEEGRLSFETNHGRPGATVDLRFEMNTLVVLNTCAHPLDPGTSYQPKPVRLSVYEGEVPEEEDASRLSRPENERAYQNTVTYNRLRF
jgi:hypothetical protein